MLIHKDATQLREEAEDQWRLAQVDLTIKASDDPSDSLDEVVYDDFWTTNSRSRRLREQLAANELDYWIKADVTDNDIGMEVGDWFSIGGQTEVCMVCRGREVIAGRVVLDLEAVFPAHLPVKKGKVSA